MSARNKYRKCIYVISTFILLCQMNIAWAQNCSATYCTKNGYILPVRGTVRILLIFAELTSGNCTLESGSPGWTPGQMPSDKDDYLEYQVTSNPTKYVSRYYKELSLGEYDVIGDYYPGIVQIPCNSNNSAASSGGVWSACSDVVAKLNNDWQADVNGNYLTAHGINLNDFDSYISGQGVYKTPGVGDNYIDACVIIWRNHPGLGCASGYGVANYLGNRPLKNKIVNVFGSWDGCPNDAAKTIFTGEYFHSMMGGNNFHTGGGAAPGVFVFSPNSYSIAGQENSTSGMVCGWDRWLLDYKGTRQYPVSALSYPSSQEVVSDLSIATHPNESTFILRDFVTVGDAIRIKLPHINWAATGDKKNQYLWIENRQKVSSFDENRNTCSKWGKGLHVYIQVGKDLLSSTNSNDLYGTCFNTRNGLNDHLMPLTAEGNYDFYYDHSHAFPGGVYENCLYNWRYTPYGILYPDGSSKPNPFTGLSDRFGKINSGILEPLNNVIKSNDEYIGAYKYLGLPPPANTGVMNRVEWGDELDVFDQVGRKISIGTNPASTPVYTHREGALTLENFENRNILLNNLSIEILNKDYYGNGSGAYLVKVKWDDNLIANDTRWAGNIRLRNDPQDPLARATKINLVSNKTITVDKGLSPTRKGNGVQQPDGSYWFAEPTGLILENGTLTELQPLSRINVINGSSLVAKTGTTINMYASSKITVDATSHFCLETTSNLNLLHPTASVVINGNEIYGSLAGVGSPASNFIGTVLPTGITYSGNIAVSGASSMSNTSPTLLKAVDYINFAPNTVLTPASGNTLLATIQKNSFTSDCSTASSFDVALPVSNCSSGSNPDDNTLGGTGEDHSHHDHNHDQDNSDMTATMEAMEQAAFVVYPNPTTGIVNLRLNKNIGQLVNISILNSIGEVVSDFEYNAQSEEEINLTDLTSGMYYMKIKSSSGTEYHKITISK